MVDFEGKNGSGVFYLDEDGDLYCAGLLGIGKKMDDDVQEIERQGTFFSYLKENNKDPDCSDVYFCKKGNKFEKVYSIH